MYRFAKYTHWGQGHLVSSEKVSWATYSAAVHITVHREFLGPDLGPNMAPSQFKYEQNLPPKMVYIIPIS